MLKCAITGSRGVLGRKIKSILPFKFYPLKENIEDYQKVEKWIKKRKYDLLIHLAAIVPTDKVDKYYQKARSVNINGTKNLIKVITKLKTPPKWFFYASTSHVYEVKFKNKKISENSKLNPYSKYGKTKREAEKIIIKNFKNKKIKFCIGRIFSFTDRRQKIPYVVPNLTTKIKKISNKKTLILKNINHYRDFLSTKDVSLAIKKLCKTKKSGIYNIGSGEKINLKTIALLIAKKYKKKVLFEDNKKATYLISNNTKIKKIGWKPKVFKGNLKYFY